MAGPTVAVSVPPTGLAPDEWQFPKAPRVAVILVVVGVPVSAASPVELPVGVVDVEGEALEAWRAAS